MTPLRPASRGRWTEPAIRRCRETNGTAELIGPQPGIRSVADAVYVPLGGPGHWGIYEGGREIGGANAAAAGQSLDAVAFGAGLPATDDRIHLYLGPMTAHFGHFVTDVVARLWPLVAWQGPPTKLLYHGPPGLDQWRAHDFISVMLARFGLDVDDLVCLDEPHRIPNLVVPEPCFSHGRAHQEYATLCRHIGRPFWRDDEVDTEDRPIFLSKLKLSAGSMHKPSDEGALVGELESRGVEIVFPEDLSFAQQVALLARRKTIMGIAGSALHTSLYSAPERRIIALNYWEKINANFPVIDRLNGNTAFYYAPRTTHYTKGGDYLLRWTIEDPAAAAAEMLDRANDFAGIDARDDVEDEARDRRARSLAGRTDSARRKLGRWLRPVASLLRRDPS
ncbi:glycosyltransferase family 61 protein [Methylobacterium brachythecii]|uniref:Capsular polysaccharide biosynthesis protein n=1 Tax=Methylobacterium brachythecii TaxID=1176177 RepID=A0A7W6AIQ1_9HYPH|nr:glycosyltransferase family 61 protein [Methylobacterium brachythecii]MBB3902145.1 capsular polysaccharide biosynthesis protein [Methylobacterium brachythecii]GLS44542.1 hypothetical protein GCM10007884_25300 [Methylobacterium brachythecii]